MRLWEEAVSLLVIFSLVVEPMLPRRRSGKEPACQCRRHKRHGFNPWVEKIPLEEEWQPTPVFLPGKLHGQRSLMGYSPRGCKESDTAECTHIRSGTNTDLVIETERPKKSVRSEEGITTPQTWPLRVHCRCPVNQQSWGEAP